MALDRFVRFKDGKWPSKDDVESVLRHFFAEAATVTLDGNRFMIDLPGKNSFPFKDVIRKRFGVDYLRTDDSWAESRWIEVFYLEGEHLDVLTRQQDHYTNILANGIAEMFALFWEGEVEQ